MEFNYFKTRGQKTVVPKVCLVGNKGMAGVGGGTRNIVTIEMCTCYSVEAAVPERKRLRRRVRPTRPWLSELQSFFKRSRYLSFYVRSPIGKCQQWIPISQDSRWAKQNMFASCGLWFLFSGIKLTWKIFRTNLLGCFWNFPLILICELFILLVIGWWFP